MNVGLYGYMYTWPWVDSWNAYIMYMADFVAFMFSLNTQKESVQIFILCIGGHNQFFTRYKLILKVSKLNDNHVNLDT